MEKGRKMKNHLGALNALADCCPIADIRCNAPNAIRKKTGLGFRTIDGSHLVAQLNQMPD